MFLAPIFFWGGGRPPEFLKSIYKIQSDFDHVATFQVIGRDSWENPWRNKKKHLGQNVSPSGTTVPGGSGRPNNTKHSDMVA